MFSRVQLLVMYHQSYKVDPYCSEKAHWKQVSRSRSALKTNSCTYSQVEDVEYNHPLIIATMQIHGWMDVFTTHLLSFSLHCTVTGKMTFETLEAGIKIETPAQVNAKCERKKNQNHSLHVFQQPVTVKFIILLSPHMSLKWGSCHHCFPGCAAASVGIYFTSFSII